MNVVTMYVAELVNDPAVLQVAVAVLLLYVVTQKIGMRGAMFVPAVVGISVAYSLTWFLYHRFHAEDWCIPVALSFALGGTVAAWREWSETYNKFMACSGVNVKEEKLSWRRFFRHVYQVDGKGTYYMGMNNALTATALLLAALWWGVLAVSLVWQPGFTCARYNYLVSQATLAPDSPSLHVVDSFYDGPVKVGFFGPYSSGKTTIINTLLSARGNSTHPYTELYPGGTIFEDKATMTFTCVDPCGADTGTLQGADETAQKCRVLHNVESNLRRKLQVENAKTSFVRVKCDAARTLEPYVFFDTIGYLPDYYSKPTEYPGIREFFTDLARQLDFIFICLRVPSSSFNLHDGLTSLVYDTTFNQDFAVIVTERHYRLDDSGKLEIKKLQPGDEVMPPILLPAFDGGAVDTYRHEVTSKIMAALQQARSTSRIRRAKRLRGNLEDLRSKHFFQGMWSLWCYRTAARFIDYDLNPFQ